MLFCVLFPLSWQCSLVPPCSLRVAVLPQVLANQAHRIAPNADAGSPPSAARRLDFMGDKPLVYDGING